MSSHRHTASTAPVADAPRPAGRGAVATERLLDAAYDSLLANGVSRTTMSDVARRAGVSRMTVYRHVDDLPRLIRDVLTRELVGILSDLPFGPEQFAAANDPAGVIADLTVVASSRIGSHPLMRRVLEVDPDVLVPLMTARLGSTQQAALDYLSGAIEAARAARPDALNPAPAPDLALAVLLAAQGHVFTAQMRARVDPDDRQSAQLREMVAAYLRSDLRADRRPA